jgi:hypothetical protein
MTVLPSSSEPIGLEKTAIGISWIIECIWAITSGRRYGPAHWF